MPTVRSQLPPTGICDCAHDEVFHPGGGPCDYHPDPMVSECPCFEFRESPRYEWTGPNAELARALERVRGLPSFFIFESDATNVLFDAPVEELPVGRYRAWCRTGEVPDDLTALAAKAHDDDVTATVYLDALLDRGLGMAIGAGGTKRMR